MAAQISVGVLTPDPLPVTTPVPRPRDGDTPLFELPPQQSAGAAATATTQTPVVRAHRHAPRSRHAMAVDAAIAVVVGVVAAGTDLVPPGVALITAAWPVVLLAAGLYRKQHLGERRTWRAGLVLGTGFRSAVVVLALATLLPVADPVALAGLVAVLSVASGVHGLAAVVGQRPRVVLAGRPRDVAEAILELRAANSHDVVAACLTRTTKVSFGTLPTYVGFEDSAVVADLHGANAFVVLPGSRLRPAEVRRLHWALAGVGTELCVGTGLLDVTPDRTHVFVGGGLSLLHVAPASLRGPRRWVKDVLERLAAAVGLALLMPVLLVVAVAVRLDTPGPTLFRQSRVGRDGRPFTMYKFRTMSVSADAERRDLAEANEFDSVMFKIRHDPRVSRVGRWLRRWSIDEVPQLWNVVRGDMSLVGPRPALPEEVACYDVDPTRRLVVKPGLTGLWQVSGRSDLSWSESVRLDVRYVDNWSLRMDLAIILRTARAVLGHRGAY